jgi:hypothetical protein
VHIPKDLRRDAVADYRICLLGTLDADWSAMLGNMLIRTERFEGHSCVTTLTGTLQDQAALMGVLNLVYDLGMVLLLVECQSVETPSYQTVNPQ